MNGGREVCIVGAVRTPVGRFGGDLAGVRPDDLGATVLKALVERVEIDAAEVEDVYFGCGNQAGEDNRDVARMSLLLAGFPEEVAGCTVNRLCGSGLEAVAEASRALALGEADVYVAGGVESMTRAPWAMAKPGRLPARGNQELYDTALGWRFTNPKMEELGHTDSLGQTAENVAQEHGVSREDQDAFGLWSHEKAVAAQEAGRFDDELVPVEVRDGVVERDQGPRADTSLEKLAKLRPAFTKDGSVTAGNSSPLNDGAAALMLVSREYAEAHGLEPLACVRAVAVAGLPPRVMGMGPVPSTRKVLDRAGLSLDDIGLMELNEAFASQVLASIRELGIDDRDARLNVNGGAIALGHPIGCSGAKLMTTLVHEMQRRDDVEHGLATMCIGVGQGIAAVVDRPS
ncbi:MAG TPA: thiolase family protein [Solirubrobacteraceae bacterium]